MLGLFPLTPVNVKQALDLATSELAARGLRSPRQDSEYLLITLLGCDRAFLLAHPERVLTREEEERYRYWLARRAEHYPLQYLRGTQEFYGREFLVSPAVLIPRPETELLVEVSLGDLARRTDPDLKVLDVGTGSGCIGVTLACEKPRLHVWASDISADALELARQNAARHGCGERVHLLRGDLLEPASRTRHGFHQVVSNPPYVPLDAPEVDASVRCYEPSRAVFAGESGLEVYARIFRQAPRLLLPGGVLILELGHDSLPRLRKLAEKQAWRLVEVHRDLAGFKRCAVFAPKTRTHPSGGHPRRQSAKLGRSKDPAQREADDG